VHPNEPYHIEIMRELCSRFIFVNRGKLAHASSLAVLTRQAAFREYLGRLTDLIAT
jgi:ABC-2 type transport system ATP-binding protein